jgi:hypothetical protein
LESDLESGNEGDQSIGGVGNIGVNETIGMNRIVNGPTPNGDTKLVSCFEKNPTLISISQLIVLTCKQEPNPNSIVGVKRTLGAISKTWVCIPNSNHSNIHLFQPNPHPHTSDNQVPFLCTE